MLKSAIVRTVGLCTRHPWSVIALALVLSTMCAVYAVQHFAIKTNINELISPDVPWAQRVKQFLDGFPQREILAVVDAPTPELVEQAATQLEQALERGPACLPRFASRKVAASSSATGCCICRPMR